MQQPNLPSLAAAVARSMPNFVPPSPGGVSPPPPAQAPSPSAVAAAMAAVAAAAAAAHSDGYFNEIRQFMGKVTSTQLEEEDDVIDEEEDDDDDVSDEDPTVQGANQRVQITS